MNRASGDLSISCSALSFGRSKSVPKLGLHIDPHNGLLAGIALVFDQELRDVSWRYVSLSDLVNWGLGTSFVVLGKMTHEEGLGWSLVILGVRNTLEDISQTYCQQ